MTSLAIKKNLEKVFCKMKLRNLVKLDSKKSQPILRQRDGFVVDPHPTPPRQSTTQIHSHVAEDVTSPTMLEEEGRTYKSVEDMPGPQPVLPIVGTSWVFSFFGPYSKDDVLTTAREDFLAKYGTIYREKMGSVYIVHLHDPAHIERVMWAQGKYPLRVHNEANVYWRRSRPDLYKSIGIADSTGEEWRSIRSQSGPTLLKPGSLAPFTAIISGLADDFVRALKSERGGAVAAGSGPVGFVAAGSGSGTGGTVTASTSRFLAASSGPGRAVTDSESRADKSGPGGVIAASPGGAVAAGSGPGIGGDSDVGDNFTNLRPFLHRYALEVIWKVTLGSELGTLQLRPSEEASTLIDQSLKLFDSFAKLSSSRSWWKIWPEGARSLPHSHYGKFCQAEETLSTIISKHTEKIMKKIQESSTEEQETESPSILRRFLQIEGFDPKDINTVIIDFIVAGIPTTSYFLSLLLHRLGQEEKVQRLIREELDRVLGEAKEVQITDELLASLKYLQAVLKEGFRLTTIIPGILRLLPFDFICDQYRIPAFTPILCQSRATARSPKYFSRPEEFLPERFLKDSDSSETKRLQEEVHANRFLILPFGFGARMCVGKRLAEREILILLAKIFLNFEIESRGRLELANQFLIGPKNSVPIKFVERS